MIWIIDFLCLLFRYNGASYIWLQQTADSIIRDPIKQGTLKLLFRVAGSIDRF